MSNSGQDSFANSYMKDENLGTGDNESLDVSRYTEDFEPSIQATDNRGKNYGTQTEDFMPQPAQPESAFKPIAENGNEDDQESISDYMSQLLARVNGGVEQVIKEDRNPAPPANVQAAPSDQNPGELPAESASAEPSEVEVRLPKRAPENRDGLLNMRKVANESASDALKTYDCRRLIRQMYGKLTLTIVVLCVSCGLAMASTTATSLSFFGAVVAMLMGVAGFVSFQLMSRKLVDAAKMCLVEENAESV